MSSSNLEPRGRGPTLGEGAAPEALLREREDFARQVGDLRNTLDREFGWAPRSARWLLPTLAGAAGLGFGMWLRATVRRFRDADGNHVSATRPFGRPRRRRR